MPAQQASSHGSPQHQIEHHPTPTRPLQQRGRDPPLRPSPPRHRSAPKNGPCGGDGVAPEGGEGNPLGGSARPERRWLGPRSSEGKPSSTGRAEPPRGAARADTPERLHPAGLRKQAAGASPHSAGDRATTRRGGIAQGRSLVRPGLGGEEGLAVRPSRRNRRRTGPREDVPAQSPSHAERGGGTNTVTEYQAPEGAKPRREAEGTRRTLAFGRVPTASRRRGRRSRPGAEYSPANTPKRRAARHRWRRLRTMPATLGPLPSLTRLSSAVELFAAIAVIPGETDKGGT